MKLELAILDLIMVVIEAPHAFLDLSSVLDLGKQQQQCSNTATDEII